MAGEINDVMVWLGGGTIGIGGFVTFGLWLRKQFSDMSVSAAAQKSIENGLQIGDKTIANMQVEMERMGKRIAVLEKQVSELTETLANVRLVALDCYSIVAAEQGIPQDARSRLIDHLKTIIKES